MTGTTQLGFFIGSLGLRRPAPAFVPTPDALLDDVKRITSSMGMSDGMSDADLYGGSPGSLSIDEGCCVGTLPNWGLKVFDGLLQRRLPPSGAHDAG